MQSTIAVTYENRYKLVGLIGTGGCGTVNLVEDLNENDKQYFFDK